MKRIGIIGSRRRNEYKDYIAVLEAFNKIYNHGDEIVSGGCTKGADRFAEEIAKKKQIPITIYYAEWNRHGKSAGYVRNIVIAGNSDILIACVANDRIGGTEDTIKKFLSSHQKEKLVLV